MLTLVPTPIGNLSDITLRALQTISKADIILCEDTRVGKKLIELLIERALLELPEDMDTRLFIESKQFLSFHSHNQDDFIAQISPDMFQSNVVYLSDAGTPCISDPGAKLVSWAIAHNLAFDVLPGACALNVAFCGSGIESTPFIFVGFLPHKRLERQSKLLQLAHLHMGEAYSAICYESPHRILETLQDIALLLPHTHIIVQKELTKLHEQRYYGSAGEILSLLEGSIIRGEWVIVFDFAFDKTQKEQTLSYEEALMLDIPPKVKAKILSKMSGKSIKQCYEEMLK
ncbi:16S rRNA (cytidine(1402)-2'-O)-methyltransferase [Helicobacter jaachi]|uniref:Ribosomal RNA small subunit methyltransferase I n=1 Tax=Helicobacter jaachi TaxID=1677920 RepID=A0A4U8TEL7_9HELI|nr:16S rRNA (cytidine(1402)-2'-O)-methyltransferase [Helicobacter jaachi]TLD97798.1 16S rRNA (cytidine(1402)-2'-O)-methyltransferase [Helicobacter jaachi]